ncbi:MAG: glycosyltransferase family 39 protein [Ignavibacteriales bacterium]|nr:glycosyltransferase family 39 protein [Ignavibacteriales bacterium]
MIESVKRLWNERPMAAIVLIAIVPRLVAAVFSKGYGMHDDHFGPIEQPFIIMNYLTYWTGRVIPHGHSILYPSIHYALFNLLEAIGVFDPQAKMFVVRLLHALYSLLVVVFGYKIAEAVSTRETAKKAGLILALFWVLPYLSVRNLIEVVCIPPLMAGFYYSLRSRENLRNAFTAGLWFALAFAFRYQTLLITGTVGLAFLFKKEYRQMMWCAVGFVLAACVIQGSLDIFAWGYPFASFIEYVRYNASHAEDYTTGPWYNYLLLVIGALLPPMSVLFLYGFLKNWRQTLLVVAPVLVFFILHSYFPNKQERFILPVVPAILLLGVIGWEDQVKRSPFWSRHPAGLRRLWISFWATNLVLLIPFSVFYGKKSRVEAMYALYGKPVTGLLLVGGRVGTSQPPFFYSGHYPVTFYEINDEARLAEVKTELAQPSSPISQVIFYGTEDLDARIRRIETTLALKLMFEKRNDPSFLDWVFYRLNPAHNKNEITMVYEVVR